MNDSPHSDGSYTSLFLLATGIGSKLLSYITIGGLSVFATILAIFASSMAIINFTFLFIDRFRKYKKRKELENKEII